MSLSVSRTTVNMCHVHAISLSPDACPYLFARLVVLMMQGGIDVCTAYVRASLCMLLCVIG